MRWLAWTLLALGVALALYVGSFAAVFELGQDWCWDRRGGVIEILPIERPWTFGRLPPDMLYRGGVRIWRPLVFLWAKRWGHPVTVAVGDWPAVRQTM